MDIRHSTGDLDIIKIESSTPSNDSEYYSVNSSLNVFNSNEEVYHSFDEDVKTTIVNGDCEYYHTRQIEYRTFLKDDHIEVDFEEPKYLKSFNSDETIPETLICRNSANCDELDNILESLINSKCKDDNSYSTTEEDTNNASTISASPNDISAIQQLSDSEDVSRYSLNNTHRTASSPIEGEISDINEINYESSLSQRVENNISLDIDNQSEIVDLDAYPDREEFQEIIDKFDQIKASETEMQKFNSKIVDEHDEQATKQICNNVECKDDITDTAEYFIPYLTEKQNFVKEINGMPDKTINEVVQSETTLSEKESVHKLDGGQLSNFGSISDIPKTINGEILDQKEFDKRFEQNMKLSTENVAVVDRRQHFGYELGGNVDKNGENNKNSIDCVKGTENITDRKKLKSKKNKQIEPDQSPVKSSLCCGLRKRRKRTAPIKTEPKPIEAVYEKEREVSSTALRENINDTRLCKYDSIPFIDAEADNKPDSYIPLAKHEVYNE